MWGVGRFADMLQQLYDLGVIQEEAIPKLLIRAGRDGTLDLLPRLIWRASLPVEAA